MKVKKSRNYYSFKFFNSFIYSVLFFAVIIVFINALIFPEKFDFLGIGVIIFVILIATATLVYVSQTGLHFLFKRQKLIIFLGLSLKVIDMNKIHSISLDVAEGDREDAVVKKFIIRNNSTAVGIKNMNSVNKYYNISIILSKGEYMTIDGGSFFGSSSARNRQRQYNRFKKIEERFNEYRKTRSDRMYY